MTRLNNILLKKMSSLWVSQLKIKDTGDLKLQKTFFFSIFLEPWGDLLTLNSDNGEVLIVVVLITIGAILGWGFTELWPDVFHTPGAKEEIRNKGKGNTPEPNKEKDSKSDKGKDSKSDKGKDSKSDKGKDSGSDKGKNPEPNAEETIKPNRGKHAWINQIQIW